MRKLVRDTAIIARKDLTEFSRDRMRLFSFFLMPMFMMIMVGFIFPNRNAIREAPLGVANVDRGELGSQFVSTVERLRTNGSRMFVVRAYGSLAELKRAIQRHEINGAVYVPADFSERIARTERASLVIVEDQANPQASQIFNQVLTAVVDRFGSAVAVRTVAASLRVDARAARNVVDPVAARIEGSVTGSYNYFQFVAPGIIAMIVLTAVLTGLAASVAREKEIGTLDGILISPVDRLAIIAGKAASQTVRGLVQGSLVMLLAVAFFGVRINGSLLLVFLTLVLGVFSFVGFGILVSAAATEQETATQLLFMFQFPMLFLSGVFFPVTMMPAPMQAISRAIPLSYAIEALRKVIILGADLAAIRSELLVLLAFGAVTTGISVPVFKRMITR